MHTFFRWARRIVRQLQLPHSGPAFYRLLASFLVMLVLPFATLLFNYVYAQRLLRQENLNYQNAVLVQAQMVVDEKLQSLQLFALDMQNDRTISSFLTSDDLAGGALQTEIWSLSRYLSSYTATYRNLCQSYVYSIHYDYLIGPQSADSGVSEQVIRLNSQELNRQLQEELLRPRQFCVMSPCGTAVTAPWYCCTRCLYGALAGRKTEPSAWWSTPRPCLRPYRRCRSCKRAWSACWIRRAR